MKRIDIEIAMQRLTSKQRAVFGDHLNNIVQAFYDDYYDGWCSNRDSFAESIFDIANASQTQLELALNLTLQTKI